MSSDDIEPGPTSAKKASTAAPGRASSIEMSDTAGLGPSGSMCTRTSEAAGTRPKVSQLWPQLAQAAQDLRPR